MMNLNYFFLAFVATSVFCQDVMLESSSIKCSADSDSEVVHWRPEPLTFFANKAVSVGPHSSDSALSELLHNDFQLKLPKKCSSKIVTTIKLTSKNFQDEMVKDALILVERLHNEQTGRTSKIGNPIAIKVHQSSTLLVYPFKFLYKVNGKAYEEIINRENNINFKGCDNEATTKIPTCGIKMDEGGGIGIKTQTGFCCTCEDQTDAKQTRGGQRCDVPNVNDFVKTSAHCLRFSPFWYGVYEIEQPKIFHQVQVQIFQSEENLNGDFTWSKLTQAEMVSHEHPEFVGEKMSLTYRLGDVPLDAHYLNISSRLLIPIPNPHHESSVPLPAPLIGSLGETVLVVPKSLLAPQGSHCDRVGVSYEPFLNQQYPCTVPSNSCLFNQPFDLWGKDQGKDSAEKYKLSSFGPVHENLPLKMDGETEGRILMEYQKTGPSYIDIELIPEIDLLVLSPGYNGMIESVMTDSSSNGIKVIAQIINRELVGSSFEVSVVKCTGGQVENAQTEQKPIGALKSETFVLDMKDVKLEEKGSCAFLLTNEHAEIIAARRILISPGETCICMDSCDCSCGGPNFQCHPMSKENILAAGVPLKVEQQSGISSLFGNYTSIISASSFTIILNASALFILRHLY